MDSDVDTDIAARLVTDAIASVFGEQIRPGVTVELVAVPAERSGIGGVMAGDPPAQ
ncbi:hypothetical protein [Nocardia sp. CA-290969]|uniref:hypothetical protein n=1 Tax=Nocardia sp. CA-290969 TaxID=3239986 RepID=UPI003D93800E